MLETKLLKNILKAKQTCHEAISLQPTNALKAHFYPPKSLQKNSIYCALYFCCYYVTSISDRQALDPGGWGPLI